MLLSDLSIRKFVRRGIFLTGLLVELAEEVPVESISHAIIAVCGIDNRRLYYTLTLRSLAETIAEIVRTQVAV